jgi:prepilin-type N-terminal cleavage/methylation domain-containing protein
MSKMVLDLFSVKDRQKGFTLMELLVVIAIFGLIASIVFVISQGALDSARISRGLQFSQHLQNSLGSYAAGIWKFDEGSGATTSDTSGWDNNGTLVNSPTWRCASVDTDYTPSAQGCSLEFNGSTQYVNVGNMVSLDIADLKITIETWVKTTATAPDTDVGMRIFTTYRASNSSRFSLGMRTDRIFSYANPAGSFSGTSTINNGRWHHVVTTYDGTTQKLYVDGVQENSRAFTLTGEFYVQDDTIGAFHPTDGFWSGLIDEVRIYNASLTSVQIQSQYYAGLQNLLAKGHISQEEIQQRLART